MFIKSLQILLLISTCLSLWGCVKPDVILTNGAQLANYQVSIIQTDNKRVSIISIDDEDSLDMMETLLYDDKWVGKLYIKPGTRYIKVAYDDGHRQAQYVYFLNALPAHTYIVKNLIVENSISIWLEDSTSTAHIGKVVSSTNEPILDKSMRLDHSQYFVYIPPQEGSWIITSRNARQTSLARKGNRIDETYAINIQLIELPVINTEKDFINYIKNDHIPKIDSSALKLVKDEVYAYKARADYCLQYRYETAETRAIRQSSYDRSLVAEAAGFVCRHPAHKNLAINIDYAHRFYAGHNDEQLLQKTTNAFNNLLF